MPQDVQQILFIRLSAIGDIVMASGLPSSIKQSYSLNGKSIELTWLVEAPYVSLVSSQPYVDNVIAWPKNEWRALLKARKYWALFSAIKAFRKTLKQKEFKVAIEAQGLLKSAFFAYISGAPQRIGFKSKENSERLLTFAIDKPTSPQISSEYRHLAEKLHLYCNNTNVGLPEYKMCIKPSDSVMQSAISKIDHFGLTQPFIAIAPFTTRPQKHWPYAHWQHFICMVRNHCTLPIAILGGPNDAANAEALTFECDDVISLSGKISLEESVCVVSLCKAFVGVDTGLTHLATSYEKPTVSIFGSTRPYTQTDNINTHVLFEDMVCAPCKRRPSCNGKFDCMTLVHPEKVFEQLKPYIS
ncbi:glycosyltransferase family 9 protein [Alteromonas portus]|uniref:Glycosyltransferase family 9 protein n=1 Tax=Alteromonas portus TaxID=2565549 RepID=A0A4U0Z695_9ALTE|nr:glycosyltransferase family 9 protein [Alteromonas portus]TKB01229.1 glycosyltransferase family 9 protein [Alteromonas portus]